MQSGRKPCTHRPANSLDLETVRRAGLQGSEAAERLQAAALERKDNPAAWDCPPVHDPTAACSQAQCLCEGSWQGAVLPAAHLPATPRLSQAAPAIGKHAALALWKEPAGSLTCQLAAHCAHLLHGLRLRDARWHSS